MKSGEALYQKIDVTRSMICVENFMFVSKTAYHSTNSLLNRLAPKFLLITITCECLTSVQFLPVRVMCSRVENFFCLFEKNTEKKQKICLFVSCKQLK